MFSNYKKRVRDVFGQTISGLMNLRMGKKPGHDCWNTTCNNKLKVLTKKSKCVRCQHAFCGDCVVLLPKTHEYGNKMICKKCKDIDTDEPLSRAAFREKMKKGRKNATPEKQDNENEEKEKEIQGGEAVPMSTQDIVKAIQESASNTASSTEDFNEKGNDEDDGGNNGKRGKDKKRTSNPENGELKASGEKERKKKGKEKDKS